MTERSGVMVIKGNQVISEPYYGWECTYVEIENNVEELSISGRASVLVPTRSPEAIIELETTTKDGNIQRDTLRGRDIEIFVDAGGKGHYRINNWRVMETEVHIEGR